MQPCASTAPPAWPHGASPVPESAGDRLAAALGRLEETEPLVHAYVHVDRAGAAEAARLVDEGEVSGPLAGRPFAVKEVISVAGLPAAGGSRAFVAHVADRDATVVARLRRAGAVLLGTQVSHELTCGLDEPPTRNPWALDSYPGGSSAGGGASVAVGSAAFALGTDAAGSVRIPAAMTGVVGLKPSAGLVSTHGIVRHATAPSIDNAGILARSVAEVSAVLAVVAGPDPADAATLWQPADGRAIPSADADEQLGGMRLGTLGAATRAALDARTPPEPDVWRAFDAACDDLRRLGFEIVPVEVPTLAPAPDAIFTFFSTELAAAHRQHVADRSAGYHPAVHGMLLQALSTPRARSQRRSASVAACERRSSGYSSMPASMRWSCPRRPGSPCRWLPSIPPPSWGRSFRIRARST